MTWPLRSRRSTEKDPELRTALADLDRLARDRPALAGPASTLGRALKAIAPREEAPIECPDAGDIAARARAGVPFLHHHPVEFPEHQLRATARDLARALRSEVPSAAGFARVDLGRWADAWVRGATVELEEEAARHGLEPSEAISLLRLALWPALAARTRLIDQARPEGAWAGPGCPNCGTKTPMLVEARGLEGLRFARCGRCAGEWGVARTACPACGESAPRRQRTLFVEGEEAMARVLACDACGARVVARTTLARLSAWSLLVAELDGLPLLLAANQV